MEYLGRDGTWPGRALSADLKQGAFWNRLFDELSSVMPRTESRNLQEEIHDRLYWLPGSSLRAEHKDLKVGVYGVPR